MQGIGLLSAVFRFICDASCVLDEVNVILDEGPTVFNVTQDSEPRHSAWSTGTREDQAAEYQLWFSTEVCFNEWLPTCRLVVSLSAVFGSIRDESSVPDDDEVVVDEGPIFFNSTSYLIVFNITQVFALSFLWFVVTYRPVSARWMISQVRFVDSMADSQLNADTDHDCACNWPSMYMVLQSVLPPLFS